MKKSLLLVLISFSAYAQQLAPLTVEKIMRDPKWIGTSPSNVFWSEDSKQIFFNWNPDKTPGDSLYSITLVGKTPQKVSPAVRRALPAVAGEYNKTRTRKLYEKNGDLFMLDVPTGKVTTLTTTLVREFNPTFSIDEKKVYYIADQNLFSFELATGAVRQWSDFKRGNKKSETKSTEQEKWLNNDQLAYMKVVAERAADKKATEKHRKADMPKRPKEIFIDDKNVDNVRLSPDEKFITYRLAKTAGNAKNTLVPNYVTESGFTTDIPARTKVGANQNTYEMFVYDIAHDTVFAVRTNDIPGIFDEPDFKKDYASKKKDDKAKDAKPTPRPTIIHGPVWSGDGKNGVVVVRSQDNKDRWIMLLDCATQKLTPVDRQRDEAWIGGPGTGGFGVMATGSLGWLNDNKTLWFVSEESGYTHIYSYDVTTSKKTAITSGKYEVQNVDISNDKKFFYITTNEVHPGEKQFYKLPVTGGKAEKLTSLTGNNEVTISPDEKWIAFRYSYSNKPWELYLQENKPGAKAVQITNSITDEFKSYNWRDPELTTIKARDGADIYARLFKPANPNGAAVIFVHGAGYLQNAHKWWSSYFREYMFHNLLADKGYTVLDMDYRASAGYGRDWRTGIYRFMGGKDLTDNVDGAKWLAEKHGVDPKRIGVYGGSYGGFITLMGLFTTPDVFAAGAALRPVTDWAQYNHPYTSNILNEPYTDSLAYAKSSPLYHAAGLKGRLLICHGMVDVNVHFQDAVKLSQRLIELGKDNWELAVYPMEDHGFVEPSSWTDEYKRILKLFDETLLTKKVAN
ncbi:MAG TPA: prolyl oligopeptidase family serine peptidase [Cyclobacteriaceae bacterium]|nr:prolyl oligopeptidase family serine peptidase [Cyclobacteriaceae bacterium]